MTSLLLLWFVTAQRVAELVLAQYNTRNLMLRGALELGRAHYPYMIMLHTAWLIGLWWFGHAQPVNIPLLYIFAALQVLRIYVIATLGSRWTTRIIVLPGAQLVRRGLYRFVKHPNYCIVVAEIAVLPMVFGLYKFALIFSVLNAAMLVMRINVENAALQQSR